MKKNVASQSIGVQMVSATDGSAFTGAVTVYVTGDGGAQAVGSVGSGACAHEGNGFHTYAPAQAETNYDHIGFTFTGTGAIPTTLQVYTTFPQTGDNFSLIGTAGAGLTNINLPNQTMDITGNLSGSVGSVTGAVGSVTGAVGSVTGTVGGVAGTIQTLDALDTAQDTQHSTTQSAIAALNDPTAAAVADAVWDEPIVGHLTAGTAGLSEALGSAALLDGSITGAPTSTTFTFTGGSTVANFYTDQLVYILSGTGIGQVRPISASSYLGGTTTITVDETWKVTPAAADRFAILVSHVHPLAQIASQVSTQVMTDLDANGSTVIDELTTQGDTNEGKIDTLTTTVGTAGAGLTDLGGMSTGMKGEVNAEVVDVLKTDTISEMAQSAPTATPTFEEAVMYLYMALRNKVDVTATTKEFHNDAGTVIWKKALSDDGTTYSEAEGVSGP